MGLNVQYGEKLFFDTAPIIYYIEKHPQFGACVDVLAQEAGSRRHLWVTSFISWIEALTLPCKQKNIQVEQRYLDWLTRTPFLTVVQSSSAIMKQAVYFRAEYGFKTPDAIQLATAQVAGADLVITNDQAWKAVKELRVVTLDEL